MRALICITAAFLAVMPGRAAAQDTVQMAASSGFEFTSGDYGLAEDTVVKDVPLSLSLSAGRVSVYASTSYLWSDGPAGAVSRTGYAGGALAQFLASRFPQLGRDDNAHGWGDTDLGAEVRLTQQGPTYVGVTAGASLPTGDEAQGLGTGRTDWSFGLVGEQRIADNAALTAAAGYVVAGANDDDFALLPEARDHAYANVSFHKEFSSGAAFGAGFSFTQSAYDGFDGGAEATLSASFPLLDNVILGGYASAGFTETSPDFGAGVTLTVTNLLNKRP